MEPIERLKAERVEIIARLSKIDAALADHEALQRKLEDLLGEAPKTRGAKASSTTTDGAPTESVGRRVTAEVAEFERAIRDILRVASRPLDRNELHKICVERGIAVGGKEPLNTLASRMSRMEGVMNVRGRGYLLKDRERELSVGGDVGVFAVAQSDDASVDVSE